MKQKTRDKTLRVKVNEDEWNIIQKRLEVCKVSSMSDLLRHMMIWTIVKKVDRKIRKSLQIEQETKGY